MQKTILNLAAAFVGESQARNRYTISAKIAVKEGYEQMAGVFLETAEQEAEHAKWCLRMLTDLQKKSAKKIPIITSTEVSIVAPTTIENLQNSISGEKHEFTAMYPEFSKVAKSEKLPEIAARFNAIAVAEKHHAERFQALLANLKNKSVFRKKIKTEWICRKCGYLHIGLSAPLACPSCGHPTSYFQTRQEKY